MCKKLSAAIVIAASLIRIKIVEASKWTDSGHCCGEILLPDGDRPGAGVPLASL